MCREIRKSISSIYIFTVRKEFKALERAFYLNKREIENIQLASLEKLLNYCYKNVDYYRDLFNSLNIVKNGEIDLSRFKEIPLLTKDKIRNNFDRLKTKELNQKKWYYNTSGGSTGEPVRLIQDEQYKKWVRAVKVIYDTWTGYHVGDNKVILWGSERDLFVGQETLKVRAIRWLKNETWLNAFRMDEDKMYEYVDIINHQRPVQILAYVSSIYELARFIERKGLKVYSPKAIMTSAGTLYRPMREVIERVFQAPVFNRYGSREVGDMACECEMRNGLHVSPLTHYIEILREDGTPAEDGEAGEVVVTSLVNFAMPLIRYRIGDIAVKSENICNCGRAWPLLQEVVGRVSDTFITRSNVKVHGEYFTHLLYFKDWVQKFQFIQEDYNLIRLLIVPSLNYNDSIQELLEKEKNELLYKVRLVMGDDCNLEIKLVNNIPTSPSGKYRYTISKIKSEN